MFQTNYAISLFELKRESLECNWRYLNTYLLLGKVLEQTGDFKGACDAYHKVLQEEPAFLEVRNKLLPAAELKLKGAQSIGAGSAERIL